LIYIYHLILLIRGAWETGIWAFDYVHCEPVLIIPSIAALLGDNPMQSELSCHVGMMGKHFCRICQVKGRDAANATQSQPASQAPATHTNTPGLYAGSEQHGTDESDTDQSIASTSNSILVAGSSSTRATAEENQSTQKKRPPETLENMEERIKRFLKVKCSYRSLLRFI
jgi:hypothetical protein